MMRVAEKAKSEGNIKIVEDATCTFCGCLCDDMVLTVDVDAKKITKAKNACVLGKALFLNYEEEDRPFALIGGKEATTAEAVEEAAQILANARFPIIYGMSDTTCETQRKAVGLMDMLGGTIDSTTSVCHGPTGMALQGVGESTATLGEIKNRADLVIYWGGNPAESLPRHFARYAVTAKGMYTPNRKKDRTIVNIDVRHTKSVPAADIFIQVKPGADFELLWALRALVKNRHVDPNIEKKTGVSLKTMKDLVERMKNCRYGVLFFGMGLTMTRGRHFNSAAILSLGSDLNEYTHFIATPMRGHGNVTGADTVVAWQTGYPFGVNFSRGYPKFNPGEFTATDMFVRGDADAGLILASDPGSNFTQAAVDHMKKIPMIVLDPKYTHTAKLARVAFTTAHYGINVPGTAYRSDGVPIELRTCLDSKYPSDEEVITAIYRRVEQLLIAKKRSKGANNKRQKAA